MWRGVWLDCIGLLLRHLVQRFMVVCVNAVAMGVNVLVPGWYRANLKLSNSFSERERFSGVNPRRAEAEIR